MEFLSHLTYPMPMPNFACFVPTFVWQRSRLSSAPATRIATSPSLRGRVANTVTGKRRGHWQLSLNDDEGPTESASQSMVQGEKQGQRRAEVILEELRQRLEKELPGLFTSDSSSYEMYSRDVLFEDPLNKFRGAKRYASNISFLKESPVFTRAKFYLHSSRALPDRNMVRTRWTLQMTVAALPWKPTVVFTGLSDYRVDLSSKLVVGHYDYWDSLASSAFFSPPAVVDLVSQCTPGAVLPFESLPPFVLLRRTQRLQIWKFESRVTLAPVSNARLDVDTELGAIFRPVLESIHSTATAGGSDYDGSDMPQQNRKSIGPHVAVARIDGENPSSSEVRSAVRTLRSAIADAPFADAADDSWLWVRVPREKSSRKYVHFVWIELSNVDMDVEIGRVS